MEVKTLNIVQKDFQDVENFFMSCEVFIGSNHNPFDYEVYEFNVISINKLYNEFMDTGIMLNRGWMITKYYNEDEIIKKVQSIIDTCTASNDEETYTKLESYFRRVD